MKSTGDNWDGIALDEWIEMMLKQGYVEIVTSLVKTLPEEKKVKYRELFKKIREEKKNG